MVERRVTANLIETDAAKHLDAPRHGILRIAFSALPNLVDALTDKTASQPQSLVLLQFPKDTFIVVVPPANNIGIMNPNKIEFHGLRQIVCRHDGLVLGTEVAPSAGSSGLEVDKRMFICKALDH